MHFSVQLKQMIQIENYKMTKIVIKDTTNTDYLFFFLFCALVL